MLLDIFVHGGESDSPAEILAVISIGGTAQVSIVVGGSLHQPAVILYVDGKRRLPETQFAGNLPVSRSDPAALVVHIHEKIGASPFIRFEHFHGGGQCRTPVQVLVVQGASKIIM